MLSSTTGQRRSRASPFVRWWRRQVQFHTEFCRLSNFITTMMFWKFDSNSTPHFPPQTWCWDFAELWSLSLRLSAPKHDIYYFSFMTHMDSVKYFCTAYNTVKLLHLWKRDTSLRLGFIDVIKEIIYFYFTLCFLCINMINSLISCLSSSRLQFCRPLMLLLVYLDSNMMSWLWMCTQTDWGLTEGWAKVRVVSLVTSNAHAFVYDARWLPIGYIVIVIVISVAIQVKHGWCFWQKSSAQLSLLQGSFNTVSVWPTCSKHSAPDGDYL